MDLSATLTIFTSPLERLCGLAWRGLLALLFLFVVCQAEAQVPQLRSGNATPIQGGVTSNGATGVDIPQTNLTPVGPSANFGIPTGQSQFTNPYVNSPGLQPSSTSTVFGAPTIPPSPQGSSLFSRIFSRPASAPISPGFGTVVQGSPPNFTGPGAGGFAGSQGQSNFGPNGFGTESVYGPQAYGQVPNFTQPSVAQPSYPSSIYPSSSPSTLFPGGLFSGGLLGNGGNGTGGGVYRFLQGPRVRHSYLTAGDGPSDVEIHDTDLSVVFAVPRFLYSSQPLFIIPSFSLHLWDGPNGAIGADLPGNAYSAFIDAGWETDPNQMIGTEFGVRVGAFTDFDTFNSQSIRILGKALLHFRLTPASTLRGGVFYLDRNRVKLVPAGGILWQPNPYTRFDIFFPQPKLSRYWRTIGTRDVWWYLAGDYGGGSWTIKRSNQTKDSVDMNDIRVLFGLEWGLSDAIRAGRRTGFLEAGYVFNREVEYRDNPQDNFDTDDAFMFRVGIGY